MANKMFFIFATIVLFSRVNADTTSVNRILYNSLNGIEVSEPQKLALHIELTENAKISGLESRVQKSCTKYLSEQGFEIIGKNDRNVKLSISFDFKRTILDTLPRTVVVLAEFYGPVYFEIEDNLFDFVASYMEV